MSTDRPGRRLLLAGLIAALAVSPDAADAARRRPHKAPAHAASAKAARKPPGKVAQKPVRRPARRVVAQARNELPLIVVDPGHGGRDPGAIGITGTPEKSVTLATALELKRQLEATRRYRVLLTRHDDSTLGLAERVAFARAHDATLLISIHADAAPNRHARGASVYIRAPRSAVRHVPARAGDIARALADEPDRPATAAGWLRDVMLRNLGDDIDLTPAPSREAHLYVLGSGVPSVLLEMGFLSNRQDEAELKRPAHRRVIAAAVRDAVDDYFARMRHSPGKQT